MVLRIEALAAHFRKRFPLLILIVVHLDEKPDCRISPPLNGERAGVRGETVRNAHLSLWELFHRRLLYSFSVDLQLHLIAHKQSSRFQYFVVSHAEILAV